MFKAVRYLFILPIILYQKLISPFLPGSCIYYPTCSHYAKDSIKRYGAIKGIILGTTRIFRCTGLLFTGGEDPVPDSFSFSYIKNSYKKFFKRKP